MSFFDSIVLGLVQGLTEFLPVSSSGHLILARKILALPIENSLSFDIFLNTATLLAVIYCFWGELVRIGQDFLSQGFSSRSKTLLLSLIIGSIPAGLVGFKFGNFIENAFRTSQSVAIALVAGSIVMFAADRINKKVKSDGLSVPKGLLVGIFQTFALIPGVSRSAITISGGLLSKLSREEAIRFAFLLYIPVSLGALLQTLLDLNGSGEITTFFNLNHLLAFAVSLVSGILAVRFLVRFLSKNSFTIFIIYRILLAIVIISLI